MTAVRVSLRGGTTNWATSFKTVARDKHPMSKQEFQTLCIQLKIGDAMTAASLFGLSWRTCQRYWYGDLKVPGPLARLLRISAQNSLSHTAIGGSRPTRPKAR